MTTWLSCCSKQPDKHRILHDYEAALPEDSKCISLQWDECKLYSSVRELNPLWNLLTLFPPPSCLSGATPCTQKPGKWTATARARQSQDLNVQNHCLQCRSWLRSWLDLFHAPPVHEELLTFINIKLQQTKGQDADPLSPLSSLLGVSSLSKLSPLFSTWMRHFVRQTGLKRVSGSFLEHVPRMLFCLLTLFSRWIIVTEGLVSK